MAAGLRNIFDVPELKRKLGFTFLIVVIYRIGGHITVPGIDVTRLMEWFSTQQNTVFGLLDMFVGGGLQRATVFALGIMPYISASIIFQLLPPVFPYFEKLQKEGEEGRKKITQYTRYGTIALCLVQGVWMSRTIENLGDVVINPGLGFTLVTVISLTTGTAFLMWLGEQVTARGVGNGVSLIIFAGIVAELPKAIYQTLSLGRDGSISGTLVLIILAMAADMGQGQDVIEPQKRVVRLNGFFGEDIQGRARDTFVGERVD